MVLTPLNERLLELPLFQGMSRSDVEAAVSMVKFSCMQIAQGKVVVEDGGLCDSLFFLMEGKVNVTGFADDKGYSITETIAAPDIVQPERIFGLMQRYSRTVITKTDCTLVRVGKQDFSVLSDVYEIFRLNLLNIISTQSQRLARIPWRAKPNGIRHKIARFVEERSLKPAGAKTFRIKMERLGREISESRLNTSRELNAMEAEGLITLRRGEINIKALERLIM